MKFIPGLFWNGELKFLEENWRNPKYFPKFFLHVFLYIDIEEVEFLFKDFDFAQLTANLYPIIFQEENKHQLVERHYQALEKVFGAKVLDVGEYCESEILYSYKN